MLNSHTAVFVSGPGGDICTISARYEYDNELFFCNRILGVQASYLLCIDYAGIFCDEKALRCTEPYPRSSTAWLLMVYKNSTMLEKTARRWL